jgi:hypothetical protein
MNDAPLKEVDLSVFQLLDLIRKRPGIFLDGDLSIKRIRSFLVGYEAGLGSQRLALRDYRLFDRFKPWVAAQLGYTASTKGWCNMILETCGNDETKAYDRFFELVDQFRTNSVSDKQT